MCYFIMTYSVTVEPCFCIPYMGVHPPCCEQQYPHAHHPFSSAANAFASQEGMVLALEESALIFIRGRDIRQ